MDHGTTQEWAESTTEEVEVEETTAPMVEPTNPDEATTVGSSTTTTTTAASTDAATAVKLLSIGSILAVALAALSF